MTSETRREIVILLARSVAHLYAIAGATAMVDDNDHNDGADERAAAIDQVLDMLGRAHALLEAMPDCAASVLEQRVIVHGVQGATLEHAQTAMILARAGLVINTWCTAATLLVSARATDGPLTLGRLLHMMSTMQPDERHQGAWFERVAGMAYDSSAVRQLGACYFQASEGYSLLELHHLVHLGDTAPAAALLDNAGRGALTAVRFLARQSITETAGASDDSDAAGDSDEAAGDSDEAAGDSDEAADDSADTAGDLH